MPNILFFDLETTPDYSRSHLFTPKLPKAVMEDLAARRDSDPDDLEIIAIELEETARVLATQAEYCQIVGFNFALDENEIKSAWVSDVDANGDEITERTLLEAFWNLAPKVKHIIGYNILRFDLPVILTRSALLGVEPWSGLAYWDAKPWQNFIVDIFRKRWANASYAEYKSLKELRRCLKLPVPEEYREVITMAGDSVEKLYLEFIAGDESALAKLKLYGSCDVWTTRELARFYSGYFMPNLVARRT